jgi:hypothetical protein
MARSFSVYRLEDREFIRQSPIDGVCSLQFEEWAAECLKRRLHDGDLGNEHCVRVYWSDPARRLRLRLIASIYDDGFYRGCDWSGTDLDLLATELDALATHWQTQGLESGLLASLEERVDALRRAIGIARESDAFLLIT